MRVQFFGLEVCVLHCPAEPRITIINHRCARAPEITPVLTAVLADRAGPIRFEVWRDAADRVARSCGVRND